MIKVLMILMMIWLTLLGATKKNEHYYNSYYCNTIQGVVEFKLSNNTRVDCLTKIYAIEVDWARKWYEGVTQVLYYGMMTGKEPMLLLLMKKEGDYKYYDRALKLINHYNLPVVIKIYNTYE